MQFDCAFLDKYLEFVEYTESPRVFHVWSAISGVAACMARHAWLPFGNSSMYANNYVLLVGPPGVRKSTAINTIEKLLRRGGKVRFAPADTGGARQGLIKAIRGADQKSDQEVLQETILNRINEINVEDVADISLNLTDAQTMYVCASEFATFIGINQLDMITFLTKMWDGEPYEYQVKAETHTIHTPLLSILGGTTPSIIAQALPHSAVGGGFMSRVLFVFANKKHRRIAFPNPPNRQLEDELAAYLREITTKIDGPMKLSKLAHDALEQLYEHKVNISDPRFIYYMERRYTHLIKTAMSFAAMRLSMVIEVADIQNAQTVLSSTEEFMVDALGEFGLSPLGAAKQKMLEFIEHSAPSPIALSTLNAVMKRDMKTVDLANSLAELCNAGKIKKITTDYGDAYVYLDKNDMIKSYIESLVGLPEEKESA